MANYDSDLGQLTKQEINLPSPIGQSGKSITSDGQNFVLTTDASGTVTSVGLSLPADLTVSGSPVTTSGTLSAVWASESANTFHAGPNGSSGTPTWRTIVAADIPVTDTDIQVANELFSA